MVRNSDLAANPHVCQRWPVLSQALLAGASGQLRNMATVGGNLLQRTRCGYFLDITKPCNKRVAGSGCPAVDGEHHNLAILGASEHCIATHPSDLAVALMALDAVVNVATVDGSRQMSLADLYAAPRDDPSRETSLPDAALITSIKVPALPLSARSRYRKARGRASFAFAVGSVATVLEIEDRTVRDLRLAFGAVAPMPWRARIAEQLLHGMALTETSAREAYFSWTRQMCFSWTRQMCACAQITSAADCVDTDTGDVRVPRMVGVFAAGRIVNPTTARSQIIGAMTMGIGMALHEESPIDGKFGDFVNHDLASYHVPVNADVGELEVRWIDEVDELLNPLGIKGVGEIGIVGTAAAIANAVWHATGVRFRCLPLTPRRVAPALHSSSAGPSIPATRPKGDVE
jgi:CO/xanthine dehydrogenase FAD-binding subunit